MQDLQNNNALAPVPLQTGTVTSSVSSANPQVKPRIGIIISMFPELHETFILRELAALERKGVDFEIYSLQLPRDPITLEDAIRLSENSTHYSKLFTRSTLLAFFKTLICKPWRLTKSVARLFVHSYDRPVDIIKALAILPLTLHFGELARQQGITHLHGHWANIPTTACWFLQQIHGFGWSAAIHGEDIFSPNRFLPYKLQQATFSVVCSGYFCKHLQHEIGLQSPEHIHLNYHGLDPRVMTLSSDIEFTQRQAEQSLRLVSIGRLVPTKGHDTLLRACALLREHYQIPFQLQLIGSGPEEQALRSLCKELDLEANVEFCGGMAFEDVLQTLIKADVFTLAPRLIPGHPPDGIPNVIAEAMALRVPVVTTRVSAIPELVENDVSGMLVDVDDYQRFAEVLANIAENSDMAERLSVAAFDKVERLFNQEQNINELLELFDHYTGSHWLKPADASTVSANGQQSI